MTAIRVACVRYLNTAPLVEGLEGVEGLELIPAAPAEIVGLLERGKADVGLASLIDAGRSERPLAVLGAGMIGSDGPTRTVRLFSRVPLSEIGRVHVDAESHTSAVLCEVLLRERHGISPEFEPFDAAGGAGSDLAPDAMVLIGDKVVLSPPSADDYPHELDLGLGWRELTGLPMVYAAWMCPLEEASTEAMRLGASLLDRQRRRNLARLPWLASKWAGARGWPEDLAHEYLGRLLRYDLDERARRGAERFMELAGVGRALPGEFVWADLLPQA